MRFAIRRLAFWLLGAWLFLLAHRLLFALAFRPEGAAGAEILRQYAFGLQFDIATLPVLAPLLPVVAAYALVQNHAGRLATGLRWIEFIQWLWIGFCNLTMLASSYHFTINDKHLGWEFFAYIGDLGTLLEGSFEDHPLLFLVYLTIIPVWIGAGWRLFLRRSVGAGASAAGPAADPALASPRRRRLQFAALEFCLLVCLVVLARGGFQESPVRPPDAMRYSSAYLNNVPLNGAFTISRDLQDGEENVQVYDPAENTAKVQALLDDPAAFVHPDYPLLRYMPKNANAANRPNVVVIVLESFTAKYLAEFGGDPRTAPEFQKLIEGGMFFRRFFATGGRSANGIYALFGGLPDRYGRTLLRSTEIHNRIGGLPALLAPLGYDSLFMYGGDLTFDNMDRFTPHAGFRRTISNRDMQARGLRAEGTAWGLDDRDTFRLLLEEMDALKAPFIASLFTLNTHHPYLQPPDGSALYGPETPQHLFLNSYNYSDRLIGQFMRAAAQRPYYKNTIFIFVADHAHHTDLNYLEDRHIPLLIFAPGRVPAQRIEEIASQTDLLPTVLHLAGGGSYYASAGRNLMDPRARARDYAFFAAAGLIGWAQGDHMLLRWPSVRKHVLLTAHYPASAEDLWPKFPEEGERNLEWARRFYQFTRSVQQSNRIWPEPAVFEALPPPTN